jgi:hypothetical protein
VHFAPLRRGVDAIRLGEEAVNRLVVVEIVGSIVGIARVVRDWSVCSDLLLDPFSIGFAGLAGGGHRFRAPTIELCYCFSVMRESRAHV